ncbi:radical SAM protein with 4Fe4S-binding SPASM domain [Desulfobotulus alkaliphilus]|uniref:Radical SAM protein with 4Fe4S-binding SPASM domain n=1 Tax=Desulfobotulus alkaliphilus TaxID=622671 RepID=A0A562R6T5_9BACT|nr:radical SAM protein with 4Fe4S-binding SPASM domain [Desulfobotulus alkaliphilus]
MLEPSFFKEANDLLMDYLGQRGHGVNIQIQSNLLEMDEGWIKVLSDFKVTVGGSVDGPDFLHDRNRLTSEGMASYHMVIKNVERLKSAGVPVSLLCVINNDHLNHIDEFSEWLNSVACSVRLNPLLRCGNSDGAISLNRYYEFLKQIFISALDKRKNFNIEPLSWMIKSVFLGFQPTECSFSGSCGKNSIAIFPDGNVSACGRSIKGFDFYGNIFEKSLPELLDSPACSALLDRQKNLAASCGMCEIYKWCHGGCPQVNGLFPDKKNCQSTIDFFRWLQKDGLILFKKSLLKEKMLLQKEMKVLEAARSQLEDSREAGSYV